VPEFNSTIVQIVAILIATGAIAGISAGLLGVGGGIVIVPMLYWISPLLKLEPGVVVHTAVATSLATIIPTSIASVRAHNRRGAVDRDLLRLWGPAVLVGAALGGIASGYIDGKALARIFGVVALVVAVNMALPKPIILADGIPKSRAINRLMASAIGFVSALMGIGGGTLSVPTLALFSFPIHRAVGTGSAFGLAIAVPAVFGYIYGGWDVPGRSPFSLGYVNLLAAVPLAVMTVLFVPLGAKIAHSINQILLKRCFAAFLTVTAIRMLT
jgi:uncharacterized membrane protein YfcA